MIKNKISAEDSLKRIKELAGIKPLNEGVNKGNLSTITYTEKIKNTNYGIVKENGYYFIKTTNSDVINESTSYDYIGGLSNKNDYKYPSFAAAEKNLNMMKITINESLTKEDDSDMDSSSDEPAPDDSDEDVLTERLMQDINNEQQQPPLAPGESPQAPAPAPMPSPEPMPQAAPQQQAPAPLPDAQPSPEMPPADPTGDVPMDGAPNDDDSDLNDGEGDDIDHYLGKLTYTINQTPDEDLSEDKIKAIMNSVISALPLDRVSPEERLELAKRVKRGGKKNGEEDSAPAPQQEPQGEQPAPEPAPSPEEEPLQENIDINESLLQEGELKDKISNLYRHFVDEYNGAKQQSEKWKADGDKNYEMIHYGYSIAMRNAANAVSDLFQLKQPSLQEAENDKPIDKRYHDEYNSLSKEHGDKFKKMFKDIKNYHDSRTKGQYSVDAIKQNLKEESPAIVDVDTLDEDNKINEFYNKIDKTKLVFENSKLKYKNTLIESDSKTSLKLTNGEKSYTYQVKEETVKKFIGLLKETISLSDKLI